MAVIYADMDDNEEQELTIEEALLELAILGYDNVTQEANKQNGPGFESKYVFAHPDGGVIYCDSDQDVLDIL